MFERGDIVMLYFSLPHSRDQRPHPALIISNDGPRDHDDNIYVCVMMTHFNEIDQFTFEVESKMLVNPSSDEFSQVRCHLVVYAQEKHFDKRKGLVNKMKPDYVNQITSMIYQDILSL